MNNDIYRNQRDGQKQEQANPLPSTNIISAQQQAMFFQHQMAGQEMARGGMYGMPEMENQHRMRAQQVYMQQQPMMPMHSVPQMQGHMQPQMQQQPQNQALHHQQPGLPGQQTMMHQQQQQQHHPHPPANHHPQMQAMHHHQQQQGHVQGMAQASHHHGMHPTPQLVGQQMMAQQAMHAQNMPSMQQQQQQHNMQSQQGMQGAFQQAVQHNQPMPQQAVSQQNANPMGGAGGAPGMMMQSPFQMVSAAGAAGAASAADTENQSIRGAENFYAQSKIAQQQQQQQQPSQRLQQMSHQLTNAQNLLQQMSMNQQPPPIENSQLMSQAIQNPGLVAQVLQQQQNMMLQSLDPNTLDLLKKLMMGTAGPALAGLLGGVPNPSSQINPNQLFGLIQQQQHLSSQLMHNNQNPQMSTSNQTSLVSQQVSAAAAQIAQQLPQQQQQPQIMQQQLQQPQQAMSHQHDQGAHKPQDSAFSVVNQMNQMQQHQQPQMQPQMQQQLPMQSQQDPMQSQVQQQQPMQSMPPQNKPDGVKLEEGLNSILPSVQALQGISEELMKNPTPPNFAAAQTGVVNDESKNQGTMLGKRTHGQAFEEGAKDMNNAAPKEPQKTEQPEMISQELFKNINNMNPAILQNLMSAGGEGLMQLMGNLNMAERPHKGAMIDDDEDEEEEDEEDEEQEVPDNHPDNQDN